MNGIFLSYYATQFHKADSFQMYSLEILIHINPKHFFFFYLNTQNDSDVVKFIQNKSQIISHYQCIIPLSMLLLSSRCTKINNTELIFNLMLETIFEILFVKNFQKCKFSKGSSIIESNKICCDYVVQYRKNVCKKKLS